MDSKEQKKDIKKYCNNNYNYLLHITYLVLLFHLLSCVAYFLPIVQKVLAKNKRLLKEAATDTATQSCLLWDVLLRFVSTLTLRQTSNVQ